MIPSACIVIPQWLFAVVGAGMMVVGACVSYNGYKLMDEWLLFGAYSAGLGSLAVVYGIAPYLPCIAMVV